MRNLRLNLPFSFLTLCSATAGTLAVVYIALIAFVMSYAALTVSFSQSVKNDQATVAVLESQYLGSIASIQGTNYQTLGYAAPTEEIFVPAQVMTAMR